MSCKILQENALFVQKSYKILARIALSSQCCFIAQNVWDTFLSLPLQNGSKNLAVASETSGSEDVKNDLIQKDEIQ